MVSSQAKKLANYIKDGDDVLLDGAHGTGKSHIVLETDEYLKDTHTFIYVSTYLDLMSGNIKDELKRIARLNFPNVVYVLDPLDNVPKSTWDAISDALDYAQFILVCQDSWKAHNKVKKEASKMSLKPRSTTVAKRLGVASTRVTNDQRASTLALETNTSPVGTLDVFTRIRNVFKGEAYNISNDELPWLFDNFSSHYYGKDLLKSLKALELYQRGVEEALTCLPISERDWGGISYPSYYRARTRAWRSKNNSDSN